MKITIEKITELLEATGPIGEAVKDFFTKAQIIYKPMPAGCIGFSDYRWVDPIGDTFNSQIEVQELYEKWHTTVQLIVSEFHSDRKADFVEMYESNRGILELRQTPYKDDTLVYISQFLKNLSKQKSILSSIKDLIDGGLIDCNTTKDNNDNSAGVHIVNQNLLQVTINQEIKLEVDKAIQDFEKEIKSSKPDKSIIKKSLDVIKKGADYGFGKLLEALLKNMGT